MSQELHTVRLLLPHVLVGYRWQNIGLSPVCMRPRVATFPNPPCNFHCNGLSSQRWRVEQVLRRTYALHGPLPSSSPSALTCLPFPCSELSSPPSTTETPWSWAFPPVDHPAFALLRRKSTCRCPFRFLEPVHYWSLTRESVAHPPTRDACSGVAASEMLRRVWTSTVGNLGSTNAGFTMRTGLAERTFSSLPALPLSDHADFLFGFPRQVRTCP